MPKRQRIRKYNSDEVQGEGSYVRCSRLTVGDQVKAREFMDEGGDATALGIKLLQENVVEWNWVDDNDEPLPQVADEPETIWSLTEREVEFLVKCIQNTETELKN